MQAGEKFIGRVAAGGLLGDFDVYTTTRGNGHPIFIRRGKSDTLLTREEAEKLIAFMGKALAETEEPPCALKCTRCGDEIAFDGMPNEELREWWTKQHGFSQCRRAETETL